MIIEPFSLSELGIFIGSCCAGLSGFIYSLSRSRCTTIKSCCCECERELITTPDPIENNENENLN